MNKTLFCTVLNESLTLKRRKNLGQKRRERTMCENWDVSESLQYFTKLSTHWSSLRKMLSGFITCKGCCGITELLRLAGSSGHHCIQPPAQVGSPRAGCLGLCPGRFWISQTGENSKAALDNVCQCSVTLIVKTSVSWSSCSTSCVSVWALCFLSYHCVPLKRAWLCVFTPSLHVFTYINNISLEPSLLQAECCSLWLRIAPVAFNCSVSCISAGFMSDFFYRSWHMSGS